MGSGGCDVVEAGWCAAASVVEDSVSTGRWSVCLYCDAVGAVTEDDVCAAGCFWCLSAGD